MLQPRKKDTQNHLLSEQAECNQEQVLLTIQEAADLLRSTPATMYSYIHYDQFDCDYKLYIKFGRKVLFKKSSLLRWIDEDMKLKKRRTAK